MLYLASASPRRRALLEQAGVPFVVVRIDVQEHFQKGMAPKSVAATLAARKAWAAPVRPGPGEAVLGADTVVALEGRALGKPSDAEEAAAMLRALSGRWHRVYTGFCLRAQEQAVCGVARTDVRFYPLSNEEIRRYVETGEPMDKAGAYGIQEGGALFVREIRGDYNNVVGLPVAKICRLLQRLSGPAGPVLN